MKANPGDIVVVIVDGVPYETYIDDSGVQRFRANGVIRALLNDFHAYYDALNAQYGWGPSGRIHSASAGDIRRTPPFTSWPSARTRHGVGT